MADLRWRDLIGPVGRLETGPLNAITDVEGVTVGSSQAASGEATGVTIIAPPNLPAPAGVATINGVGELTAKLEIDERGVMETPVHLCGSHAIGTVLQAAINGSGRGPEHVVLPVVGECDDGDMADSRTVVTGDVDAARQNLGRTVDEGTVGAGTGMSCFDFPGGIGTASRTVGQHRVGVLLLCNFGSREYLALPGIQLDPAIRKAASHGSCIAICATDAPLSARQLKRLALRPLLGLARAGSFASEGSGEIGLAFSTADGGTGLPNDQLNPYLAAAWESAHEAVYNCLVAARPGTRLDGSSQDQFPIEQIVAASNGET
ncbi:MAG: P1 family peptidase [Solirubrobacterales bacterium]